MEHLEVYIPKEACVRNIPFQSLSSSTVRKISSHVCQNRSETAKNQLVTCISPVELRDKTVADSCTVKRSCMTNITSGQFWLPVVSSSVKAYKVLKNILPAHKPPIQMSVPEHEDASDPLRKSSFLQKNSFIVFNNQIFLSVKKSKDKRVSFQNLTSSSSFSVSVSQQQGEDAPRRCEALDASISQEGMTQDQTGNDDTPTSTQEVSEVTSEQHCPSKEGQKASETTSDSTSSPSNPSEDLEPEQTTDSESKVPEGPETAGGEGETHEQLEIAEFLPRVESSPGVDFQLLAKEESINRLRARLKQKEAALSILKSKATDQV